MTRISLAALDKHLNRLVCAGLIIAVLLAAKPATAVEFPLSASAVHNAIIRGSAVSTDDIAADAAYEVSADRETWPGYTPSCNARTPYFTVAFAAAEAHTKYTSVPASVKLSAINDHTIEISANLFSTVLGTNKDAVGVIKQGERLVRSTKREYFIKDDVVDTPEVGYKNVVSFTFDLKRFNPNKPFTVTVANVTVNTDVSGEFNCKFDGSQFQ